MEWGMGHLDTKANSILLHYFTLKPAALTHDVTLTELYVLALLFS
jgi:hypothetical protein